jgi:hypothetical protein
VNDSAGLDVVVLLVDAGDGEGELLGVWFGDGVPAGDGLGSSGGTMPVVLVELAVLWPRMAIAVPQPAITNIRTTIPPMISSHGTRCTIGCGPTALAA